MVALTAPSGVEPATVAQSAHRQSLSMYTHMQVQQSHSVHRGSASRRRYVKISTINTMANPDARQMIRPSFF